MKTSNSNYAMSAAAQASNHESIGSRLEENNALIKASSVQITKLNHIFDMCVQMKRQFNYKLTLDSSGYFQNLGAEILSFIQKIWSASDSFNLRDSAVDILIQTRQINFMTYKAVVSLQRTIPAQLERSWTQEPVTLDDALGRVTPVHLEFLDSWEVQASKLQPGNNHWADLVGFRSCPRNSFSTTARSSEDTAKRVRLEK